MKILHRKIPLAKLYVNMNTGEVYVFHSKLDMYTKDNPKKYKNFKLSNQILRLVEMLMVEKGERY